MANARWPGRRERTREIRHRYSRGLIRKLNRPPAVSPLPFSSLAPILAVSCLSFDAARPANPILVSLSPSLSLSLSLSLSRSPIPLLFSISDCTARIGCEEAKRIAALVPLVPLRSRTMGTHVKTIGTQVYRIYGERPRPKNRGVASPRPGRYQ